MILAFGPLTPLKRKLKASRRTSATRLNMEPCPYTAKGTLATASKSWSSRASNRTLAHSVVPLLGFVVM